MRDVRVPQANSNDDSYVLRSWLVPNGAPVQPGTVLAVLETSKTAVDVEAEAAGLIHRVALEGSDVRPGDLLARLAANSQELSALADAAAPKPQPEAEEAPRFVITQAARELMAARGLTEAALAGLGKRVIKASDIEALTAPVERAEALLSRHQAAVARAVSESQRDIPQAYLALKVYCGRALELARCAATPEGDAIGLPELLVRVLAERFDEHRRCFGAWKNTEAWLPAATPNIGVTLDLGRGLFVAVVRDPRARPLSDIAEQLFDYRIKALRDDFAPQDLADGSLTLSLTTDADVSCVVPLVFPGQSCIVALTAVQTEWDWAAERPTPRPYVQLGLAYDHRLINGQDAVAFMSAVKHALEAPEALFAESSGAAS
jgi:2-oxoglutarate dehydrogenase E2 component (dihydrolipoamide succinyltransferase)